MCGDSLGETSKLRETVLAALAKFDKIETSLSSELLEGLSKLREDLKLSGLAICHAVIARRTNCCFELMQRLPRFIIKTSAR